MKILSVLALLPLFGVLSVKAQKHDHNPDCKGQRYGYNELAFYVCAHQDDWQLFMGASAFNDINSFDEKGPPVNGKKVVIIYTTAGNLHDDDDTKSCDCKDGHDPRHSPLPYWRVREQGAKNSVHLAACRLGGWGPSGSYHGNQTTTVNGHQLTRYQFKNTTSYFLRIKAGQYHEWYNTPDQPAGTVDSSTTYIDFADFANTLYYIYKTEMDSAQIQDSVTFNFPDVNEQINPNDHVEHYLAGRGACEAAKILSADVGKCFAESLYVDYHTLNLPVNTELADRQNEAALTAVYCMALLDYNAWPEWGSQYQEWTARNYSRTITSWDLPKPPRHENEGMNELGAKLIANPADKNCFIRFNLPTKSDVTIRINSINGDSVYQTTTRLDGSNTIPVDTHNLPNGSYMVVITAESKVVAKMIFEVLH